MPTFDTACGIVHILDTAGAVARDAAFRFESISRCAIDEKGSCAVALSGGTTPQRLYQTLIEQDFKSRIEWSKIHFFVSDERCVSQASSQSNYGVAWRDFLSRVPVPPENLHPTEGQDTDAEASASAYEKTLRTFFGTTSTVPSFDLIFLGLGPEGHTASLFPGSKALEATDKLVMAVYVDSHQSWRITFTPNLINAAANVIFLVCGESKGDILPRIFSCDHTPALPAQYIRPANGRLEWFVDREAARKLNTKSFKPIATACF